jgi:predicted oxidoreductase
MPKAAAAAAAKAVSQAPVNLSPVAAGLWRLHEWGLDVAARVRWIEQALELGITTFDHADIYGDHSVEALFGEALAAAPTLRARLQIVTKCGIRLPSAARPGAQIKSYDSSPAHIEASVEHSLRALRMDYIDVLLIHRPDLLAEPEAMAECFRRLHAAGKVRAFGVSNHDVRAVERLHRFWPLAVHQVEFSPLQMKALADGTLEQCADLGIRPMLWSPLGRGRLFDDGDDQARRVRDALEELGRRYGAAPETMAFAWLMRHPSRPVPVTGSRRIERLAQAAAAARIELGREDWYRVWQASMGHEVA